MTKISTAERNLAAHMVGWFVNHGGQMGIDSLSRLTGIEELELQTWASERGYLWGDDDSLSLSALPLVWVAFAHKSRSCRAMGEVYQTLKNDCKIDSQFYNWVKDCESDPTLAA